MKTNTVFEAIAELNLEPIKTKLMHEASGEGWSRLKADAIALEYRRFLYLMHTFPNEQIAPTMDVDMFWHYHILDTMKYAADCEQVFGYFLHHYPYVELDTPADQGAEARGGQRMQELYEQTFGEDYIRPGVYGPGPAHAGSAGTAYCMKQDLADKRSSRAAYCMKQDTAPAALASAAYCMKQQQAYADGASAAYCMKQGPAHASGAQAAYCMKQGPAQPEGASAAYCIKQGPASASGAQAAYCMKQQPAHASGAHAAYCMKQDGKPASGARAAYCMKQSPSEVSGAGAAYCMKQSPERSDDTPAALGMLHAKRRAGGRRTSPVVPA